MAFEIREILRTTPTIQVEEMDGSTRERHVINEYNIVWCWNEDEPLEFSEQTVTPDNHTEVIIDRPLSGTPVIDEAMYNQHGLHPLSYQELTDQHVCVIAQIIATTNWGYRVHHYHLPSSSRLSSSASSSSKSSTSASLSS
jgi:hypothetical protein